MNSEKLSLKGKNAIVTGSSMGIGQAIAVRLAAEGANVIINARGEQALNETLALTNTLPGKVIACCGSVSDFDFAGQLIQSCLDHFGSIDALINCAGIAEPEGTSILNIDPKDWQQLIDVHLHATFNTCRHAAPIMAKQGYGAIINTSSHAFLGMYGGTGYASGKGAVTSLSYAMAMDLKEHKVRVNVVCPGAKTRLSTGDDYEKLIKDLNSRGLLDDSLMEASLNPPDPSYVSSLYAYLISDAAQEISGRVFWGAGGYVGHFHRNPDQLLGFKNHEFNPPWTIEELDKKLTNKINTPEELFQVLYSGKNLHLLFRQKILIKLAGSALMKWLQSKQKNNLHCEKLELKNFCAQLKQINNTYRIQSFNQSCTFTWIKQ